LIKKYTYTLVEVVFLLAILSRCLTTPKWVFWRRARRERTANWGLLWVWQLKMVVISETL